jgi:hypothetical protein
LQTWTDNVTVDGGRNGCDTRNDILRRDLVNILVKPGSKGCAVESGTLNDPYTAVQIDHVVALSNAWQTGAQQLTPEKRADFANDPRNLQASDRRADEPAQERRGCSNMVAAQQVLPLHLRHPPGRGEGRLSLVGDIT